MHPENLFSKRLKYNQTELNKQHLQWQITTDEAHKKAF